MTLTIGITTYNRKALLEQMAASLRRSRLVGTCNIRVYDDCSTEFDLDYLQRLLPDAATIVRSEKNGGPDANTWAMYKDFVASGDEFFFNADADLLFDPGWLEFAFGTIDKTDGVLSLFNTINHETIGIIGPDLCEKRDLGAAGTFFRRGRVVELLGNIMDGSRRFDWQWSEYLAASGVRILCSRRSYVQHIGIRGFNTSGSSVDFGTGFVVGSQADGQVLNDVLESYIESARHDCERKIAKLKRSTTFRIGLIVLAPFRAVAGLVRFIASHLISPR